MATTTLLGHCCTPYSAVAQLVLTPEEIEEVLRAQEEWLREED
jgi:hypothetical protein